MGLAVICRGCGQHVPSGAWDLPLGEHAYECAEPWDRRTERAALALLLHEMWQYAGEPREMAVEPELMLRWQLLDDCMHFSPVKASMAPKCWLVSF